MFKRKHILLLVALVISHLNTAWSQDYKNPALPVEKRVKDLLGRMTLEEKIAQMQMNSLSGFSGRKEGYGVCESPFIHVREIAAQSYKTQRWARDSTRLGIPFIQIGECLHGLLAFGATIFPQAIAQGSTWNPELVKKMSEAIAVEASAAGVNQALSPLFDLIHDPRYGRNEECYSEDPFLTGTLGTAFVIGMQGDPAITGKKIPAGKIMCTAKHFAGYSIPAGGINLGPSSAGEREMRSLYLPPFEMAVKQANVYAVMPSYNEVDGVPAHANQWLLNQVLRKEWDFKGYVFADYGGLSMNCDFHKVSEDRPSAAVRGITAGVDLEAPRPDVYSHLFKLVENKKLQESVIDTAVARILRAKFKAGLFEKPLPDTNKVSQLVHTPMHQELAKEVARESVVLLKNDNNLLPFKLRSIRSLAVIGPNADQVQYGDYSYTRDNKSGITVLQGLHTVVDGKVKLNYAKGCNITGSDTSGFAGAVNAARNSDAVVMVMGETSAVLSGLGWGKGPGENEPSDPFTCGEGYDVDDINLPGVQGALIRTVVAEGKPVVLVLVHGRPASIGWEKEHLPAILEAWYPGEQGGIAIAEILFGKINPSGRLNVSIPKTVGQIPIFYNHKPSGKGYYHQPGTPEKPGRDYVFSTPEPLFPFGFGLSYTSYNYENFKLSANQIGKKDSLVISVDIINTGGMAGKEVVQLYVRDKISSTTTPVKSLKGFKKIHLLPGGRQTVSFLIKPEDLGLWNADMQYVTEPGEFEIMVGRSSADILHNTTIIYTDK